MLGALEAQRAGRFDDELVGLERLLREARAQARVDHPAVCQVYEVGTEDGRPFIAMQFVEGPLLDEAVRDLTIEQKVLLIEKVAEAVAALIERTGAGRGSDLTSSESKAES